MKYIIVGFMFFAFNITIGQSVENQPSVTVSDNKMIVELVDELGGTVTVVYTLDREKIFQSRSDDKETIYAIYEGGKVIKSGVVDKRMSYQEMNDRE
jgi:hypothetical protein